MCYCYEEKRRVLSVIAPLQTQITIITIIYMSKNHSSMQLEETDVEKKTINHLVKGNTYLH